MDIFKEIKGLKKLTKKQKNDIESFKKHMEEIVIPELVKQEKDRQDARTKIFNW